MAGVGVIPMGYFRGLPRGLLPAAKAEAEGLLGGTSTGLGGGLGAIGLGAATDTAAAPLGTFLGRPLPLLTGTSASVSPSGSSLTSAESTDVPLHKKNKSN